MLSVAECGKDSAMLMISLRKVYLSISQISISLKSVRFFVLSLADMEPEFEGTTPRFTQKLQDVDVLPGKVARMECRVIGDPHPDVRWYRENEPLLEGGRYKFVEEGDLQVLVISDVSGSDEGVYKCVARNVAGKAHSSAELFVMRK